jgi:hypothetical protein
MNIQNRKKDKEAKKLPKAKKKKAQNVGESSFGLIKFGISFSPLSQRLESR